MGAKREGSQSLRAPHYHRNPSLYVLHALSTLLAVTHIGSAPLLTALGVGPSDSALLYIFCSPTGPFFRLGPKQVSLYAVGEQVRAWPGGTGEFKLSLNYAPTFWPQQLAAEKGYDQCLWLLGQEKKVTEAGAMNFFVVLKRDDSGECDGYSILGALTLNESSSGPRLDHSFSGWYYPSWCNSKLHSRPLLRTSHSDHLTLLARHLPPPRT